MRRFFSNFAGGWPALGLLLIRLSAGAALILDGKPRVQSDIPLSALILGVLEMADGAVLIAGLWTPLAGLLSVALSTSEILIFHDTPCPAIFLASMGAGLAFVGPGAFSIDAWLFGLKRIDIDKLDEPPNR